MPEIGLTGSFSAFVVVLGLATAAGLSYAAYRRTLPPVPPALRLLLGGLRFLSLALLFIILGAPVLSIVSRDDVPPAVAVLVDNSASMTLVPGESGDDQLDAVLRSDAVRMLGERARLRWFVFDHSLRPLERFSADSVHRTGDRTDIAGAFASLRPMPERSDLRAVVLISDGNATTQALPHAAAEQLALPVFTVGVGDTNRRRDAAVTGVLHNSIAYAGSRVPVQVSVRAEGLDGATASVVLRLAGREADSATLTFGTGAGDYRTTLFITPESPGTIRGEVTVTRFDGEATVQNNASVFFTRVLSGKRTVLLLAGAPDPDVGFIRRSLEADSNLTVRPFVGRPDGTFAEGDLTDEEVRRADVLVLVGFPGPSTDGRTTAMLAREEFIRKPALVMLGRTMDLRRMREIDQFLPATVRDAQSGEMQVFIQLTDAGRRHPIARSSTEQAWSSLPPVFAPATRFAIRPEAIVVGSARLQNAPLDDPLLVVRSVAGRRTVAMLGYGLWRWKMLSPPGTVRDGVYDAFVSGCIQWLTAAEDLRRFRTAPASEVFSAFEPPVLRAEVYDESMRPVPDASVVAEITGPGRSTRTSFRSIDNGQYEAALDALPPGEFAYTATARLGGNVIGEDRGTFNVGGLNAEFLETKLNRPLLQNLAFRTGGAYVDAAAIGDLPDRIAALPGFGTQERVTAAQTELWNSAWVLGLVILLLSLEWFLRKRYGLL